MALGPRLRKIINRAGRLALPFAVLLLALLQQIYDPLSLLEDTRLKTFDYFQRLSPRIYDPQPVRIVDIDDATLEKIGQWPWPRTEVAELVAQLANAGAASIAFDIVFSEPDRTSPQRAASFWPKVPETEELQSVIKRLPDHDEVLADILKQAGNVVTGFVLLSDQNNGTRPAVKGTFAYGGDDPTDFIDDFLGATKTLPVLEEAAAGNGTFNQVSDNDGVTRRVPLVLRIGKQNYPSLSAEALRVAQGAKTDIIKASGANLEASFGGNTGIASVKIGQFVIPTDDGGNLLLHFTRTVPERSVPAWKILSGDFDPAQIDGNIIFIGTSAAGLKDLRQSPINPAMPGVEAHANAVEQVLSGHYLQRPDYGVGVERAFILTLGTLLILLSLRLNAIWGAALAALAIAGAFGGAAYLFIHQGFLFDPLSPSLAVLLIYLTASLQNFMRTEAEKKQVRGAFAQYLSPALVEQLAKEPDRLKLGGETKNMTFLFCDVRGFTTISEQFKTNPQGLTRLMNRFLTPLTDVILSRRGTIDKYMGDCIMAFWNAPFDVENHPNYACESALVMFDEIAKLNVDLEAEAKAENRPFYAINIGIGLNSGDVVVGNMGSTQRFDYSVLGDAVNLASRLEGQSKTYGVNVVIGDTTNDVAKESYATIELDLIAVKGKKEAVRIHALLGHKDMLDSPEFQAFRARQQTLLALYRAQKWDECEQLIAELRQTRPDLGGLYDLYEERIADYRLNPPGENWDGVFAATSK